MRGPDDPSKCPAGNYQDCCGDHAACTTVMLNDPKDFDRAMVAALRKSVKIVHKAKRPVT